MIPFPWPEILAELDKETLEKLSLKHIQIEAHHIRWLIYILLAGLAAAVFNMIFGKRIREAAQEPKQLNLKPLEVQKIVVDETNNRQGVRVAVECELDLENSRLPDGKKGPQPTRLKTVDVSLRGMAFVSDAQFPPQTDLVFRVMETAVVASPILTGTVVACRPWEGGEAVEGQPAQWLTSLKLKNLSGPSSSFINRLVNEAERHRLHDEADPKVSTPESSKTQPDSIPDSDLK